MSELVKTRISLFGRYVSSGQLWTYGRMGLGPGSAKSGCEQSQQVVPFVAAPRRNAGFDIGRVFPAYAVDTHGLSVIAKLSF